MNNEATQRLDRIVDNIRSKTAFDARYSKPQSLVNRMAEVHTPGVSVAIIDDYDIAAVGSYGVCEAGGLRPVDENTRFLAGSVSKPVFAAAIMYLVQTGKLDLDKDVNHYLKSWKIPANEGWQPHITLRQLLSHTSGLTVHGFLGYLTTEEIPDLPQILNGEHPANSAKVEVNSLPGLDFCYSGGGITVAQLAMTDYFNDAFPALMKRLVFEPLGMHNSTFENPLPSGTASTAAVAHPWKSLPIIGGHHVYPEAAAAGLWTTPTDLAKFGIALQKSLQGEQTSFLDKTTIETMLSPQLAYQCEVSEFVGLGFFVDNHDTQAVFRHGGWDQGFIAEIKLYKDIGKGAVVMINSNEGQLLLGEIERAIAHEFNWPRATDVRTEIPLTDLVAYVGQYESEKSTILFTVEEAESGLLLHYDVQPPVLFKPCSKLSFFSNQLNTELTFESDSENSIAALSVRQNNVVVKALKKTDNQERKPLATGIEGTGQS